MTTTLRLTYDDPFIVQEDAIDLFARLAVKEATDLINVTLSDGGVFFFERQGYVYHYDNDVTPAARMSEEPTAFKLELLKPNKAKADIPQDVCERGSSYDAAAIAAHNVVKDVVAKAEWDGDLRH